MTSFDFMTLAVAVLAVGGLVAVVGEILVKAPRSLLEMTADTRRFAEAPLATGTLHRARRTDGAPAPAANLNAPRIAA